MSDSDDDWTAEALVSAHLPAPLRVVRDAPPASAAAAASLSLACVYDVVAWLPSPSTSSGDRSSSSVPIKSPCVPHSSSSFRTISALIDVAFITS